jgi:hypothetical protein
METLTPPLRRRAARSARSARAPQRQRWSSAVLMSERRRDRRMSVSKDVRLLCTDRPTHPFAARLRNLSRCGMYVETAAALSPQLLVHFELPGETSADGLWLSARIVHRRADGVGLALDVRHPHAAERLQSLLALCQR